MGAFVVTVYQMHVIVTAAFSNMNMTYREKIYYYAAHISVDGVINRKL